MTTTMNVSVEWLMKNIEHSIDVGQHCTQCKSGGYYDRCDCDAPMSLDLAYMIDDKVGVDIESGCDSLSYGTLLDSILAEGIKKPICLVWCDNYQGSFTGWMMGNGHHRLALSILACLDTVPIVVSTDAREYMMSNDTSDPDDYTISWDRN